MTTGLAPGPGADRRSRRRRETLEEILETSLAVMAEAGVSGLSLGEVARRMGMRAPSLYQYVGSKHDVYDALFRRGWEQVYAHLDEQVSAPNRSSDPRAVLTEGTAAFVGWMVEHPVLAQLMVWRPVPGFEPTAEAFAPARECLERFRALLVELVGLGLLHPAAAEEEAVRLHTVLVAGVISQHLSNEPGATYDRGSFTTLVPELTDLFVTRFTPSRRHP